VEGETEALVVDTKFPPGSGDLRHWVSGHVKVPVTRVVNTHYHYDHTLGNDLYPGATVLAHVEVPSLLREREPDQVREHPSGVPAVLVNDPLRLEVGGRELLLFHPGAGAAHTRGDLVVYLPREKVLAVGDLLFNGYYPFFDLGHGGADVPGLIRAARELAAKYPDATVVPGHGPIARAPDLLRYADYLEALWTQVQACRSRGCTEDQAAASIDLSRWGLSLLPSFHGRKLEWATAERNVRNAFHLAGALTP
ncbi:MAG TPA: MBL fold metallo-hydrolase, partial [Myxococcales bacterium]|nr:MBL fold metallo-hydrolase [Myxococcales bacterium]